MCDSTKSNYYGIWKNFNKFYLCLDKKPSNWEDRIVLYIGYLISNNRSSQTLRCYISAIRATLLDDGYELKENKFLLSALTCACKFKNDILIVRKGMMKILIKEIGKIFIHRLNQPYLEKLYKALISTTYFGLLIIRELTKSPHAVKVQDVHVRRNKNKILFVLRSSKTHGIHNLPQTIKITVTSYKEPIFLDEFCPFTLLRKFLQIRPGYRNKDEQFFVFRDHSPVKPEHFRNVLKLALKSAGFDPENFSVHSLCIGKASDLLRCGLSVETIKKIGR